MKRIIRPPTDREDEAIAYFKRRYVLSFETGNTVFLLCAIVLSIAQLFEKQQENIVLG